jgi:hypothetical protein
MSLTAHDLIMNADLWRKACPSWPHPEPPAPEHVRASLAEWIEREGIAPAEIAVYVAGTLLESPAMRRPAEELHAGRKAPQMLRDAATGVAALARMGDEGWAMENYRHGHGRKS